MGEKTKKIKTSFIEAAHGNRSPPPPESGSDGGARGDGRSGHVAPVRLRRVTSEDDDGGGGDGAGGGAPHARTEVGVRASSLTVGDARSFSFVPLQD